MGSCLCDLCQDDGCRCRLRAMRAVVGCIDFQGKSISTDGDLYKDCHNEESL